jgi:hypothetical protein
MQLGMDGVTLEPVPIHPRLQRVQDQFSQDWYVYNVLTSPLGLATYVELDTVCNTEDLYKMFEIVQVHKEMETVAHIQAKLTEGNK